jgi:hypothetical protein
VVIDRAGRGVRQFNGLASWYDEDRQRWRQKPIGYLPDDRLRGYDTNSSPNTFMPIHGEDPKTRRLSDALGGGSVRALAECAGERDLSARLSPAVEAVRRINALSKGPDGGSGAPYPFLGFGPNSNSLFSTLLVAMGLEEPRFADPVWLAPGERRLLLDGPTLSRIRALGAPAAASAPDGVGV